MQTLTEIIGKAQNEITRLNIKEAETKKIRGARNIILSQSHMSFIEARDAFRRGYITEYEYFLFRVSWNWMHYRISSLEQEKYCNKYSFKELTARINKFRGKLGLKSI